MKRRGDKGFAPAWHFKVKRVADVIVASYRELMVVASENFAQWSCEKWVWRTNLIKNGLIELNILPWPIPTKDNWFTRIHAAPQNILATKGDVMKLKFQIGKIMPLGWNPIGIMDLQIESKDWIPFEKSEITKTEPCKVPFMKNLDHTYRVALEPEPKVEDLQAKTPKSRIPKKKSTSNENGMHVVKKLRKRTPLSSEFIEIPPENAIVLSDSECKPKRLKQQKLNHLKKVKIKFKLSSVEY